MENRPRVYINNLDEGYLQNIRAGLDWLNLSKKISWGDTVFIKPNLTFPVFRKGVMTTPECIEAIVIALKDYTNHIIVGEADSGGYNRFSITDVFEKTGIKHLEEKYNIKISNLSNTPYRNVNFDYKGHHIKLPLPELILDNVDLFITAPVPKIHMNTGISAAIKNQWGCIPIPRMRLKLHPYFEKVVYEVNKNLRTSMAIIDGKYGLNRSGPMEGDSVDLNWIMLADDIFAADLLTCHLMQINPRQIYYLEYLRKIESVIPDIDDLILNQNFQQFIGPEFYLSRTWTDLLSTITFRIPIINYTAYYSPFADFLHKIYYLFRKPFYNYEDPEQTEV